MFQQLLKQFLQKFVKTMGRGPNTRAEWMQIQDEAVRHLNKTKGAPSIKKDIPGNEKITIDDVLEGPVTVEGPQGPRIWDLSQKKGEVIDFPNKGIRGLMEKGDVNLGTAPKTTKETLKTKKDRGILLRDADEDIARIKKENKQAVEDFKKKFHKKDNVEDVYFDHPDDPRLYKPKKDPDKFYAGGIAPLVGEPSYAANFYDDRTPMKRGKKVKQKKTALEAILDVLPKELSKKEKIALLKKLMPMEPSLWRRRPHGKKRYEKELPEGILELLEKDPGFDREAFEDIYWAGEGNLWTDPGWYSGRRGSYNEMTGDINLHLSPFGEKEYPHWKLRSPHQDPTALKDVDKAKIAAHELRHKNILEDRELFETQPEWVQRQEGPGYLPSGDTTGHELYNRFLDQRYYPPDEQPSRNDPYFDKILKDHWEPHAKAYEDRAKRRLAERRGEGIETLAAQGGRIGLAGGGGIIKLLKKFLKKKPKKDVIKPFEFPDVGIGSDFQKKVLDDMLKSKSRLKDFDPKGKPHAEGGRIGLAGGGLLKKFIEKLFIKASNDIRQGRGKWKGLDQKQIAVQHDNLTKKVTEFQKTGKLPEGTEQYFDVNPHEAFAAASKKVKTKKVDKNRKLTEEEWKDFVEDNSGDLNPEVLTGDETLNDLENMVAEQRAYADDMYQQYKRGDLDKYVKPEELEKQRLFRQKKIDNVLAKAYDEVFYQKPVTGDYKYDADVLADSIAEQLGKGAYTDLPQTHQTQIYNTALKRVTQDMQMEKTLKNVEEKMILSDFDVTGKKPHAEGGRADFIFGGSAGLKAMWKTMMKGISKGRDKPIKKLFPKLSADERRMEKMVMGTPEQKAFREIEAAHKIEGIDLLINRLRHDKKILERQAKNKAMGDPGLNFLMKDLEKSMSDVYTPHLGKYTDIDKDILQMENIKKNLIMKDRKLHQSGGLAREGYAEGTSSPRFNHPDKRKGILGSGVTWTDLMEGLHPFMYSPGMIEGIKRDVIDPIFKKKLKWDELDDYYRQLEMDKDMRDPESVPSREEQYAASGGRVSYSRGGLTGLPAVTMGMPQMNMQQPQMPAGPQPAGIPGGTIVAQNQMQQAPWMGSQMQQGPGGMPQRGQPRPGGMPQRGQPRMPFGLGGFSKARRAFLKMMAGVTGAGVAAGTGLLKLGKVAPKAIKETTEVITRGADGMPAYLTDLIEVVKAKGTKDIIEGFKRSDYSTVHSYKGVDVTEDAVGNIKIKSDLGGVATDPKTGKTHEGIAQEHHMQIERGEWIEPTKTKKGIQTQDEYIEGTVRPDHDGKMKDFEEGLDKEVHDFFKKIADEGSFLTQKRTRKASGGLAYALGE
jgi:hypothetical protein